MSFKQFLHEKYGIDIAAFKRKASDVQASIYAEYKTAHEEDKRTVRKYRKSNETRRDVQRKANRADKMASRVDVFEYEDGEDDDGREED